MQHAGPGEVFWRFLRLGLISFGGPVAHLGQFQAEFVERRKWLDAQTYADTIAFCQFLPGPSSTQVGMSIGLRRAGVPGMIAAGLGFMLPTACVLITLAYGVGTYGHLLGGGWLRGLHAAVVAIVAWAVWGMAAKLCPTRQHATIALGAAIILLAVPTPSLRAMMQFAIIGLGALWGWAWLPRQPISDHNAEKGPPLLPRLISTASLSLLTIGAILLGSGLAPHQLWDVFSAFFRVGFLVFGGGHVVLPMLAEEVVTTGWLSETQFMTGYGLTQAMPGPIFTLSAYLGASMATGWMAITYALAALGGIFLPSYFMVAGLLPTWDHLRRLQTIRAALAGIAAAVVGLLLAALYDPIVVQSIREPCPHIDLALTLGAFALLGIWNRPTWFVVITAACAGMLLEWLGVVGYSARYL